MTLSSLVLHGTTHSVKTFAQAKKTLMSEVYDGLLEKKTFYCGCPYDDKKKIDLKNCSYKPRRDKRRGSRVEWEHIVPAHAFGQSFEEWREGHPSCFQQRKGKTKKNYKGRRCARKVSSLFRQMEADPYNLVPAVGEINGDRRNFSMADLSHKKKFQYGKCPVFIEGRKIDPPDSTKGFIARVYMYMEQSYPGHGVISRKNRKLYELWNKKYPVTKEECLRYQKIKKLTQKENEVLKPLCHPKV